MVYNKGIYSYIYKKSCKINNGKITSLPEAKGDSWQIYDPLNYDDNSKPIFFKFAALKTDEDIVNFVSKYGFLYRECYDYTKGFNARLIDVRPFEIIEENLNEFKKEILIMRSIIELKGYFDDNSKELNKVIKESGIKINQGDYNPEITKLYDTLDYSKLDNTIDFLYSINGRSIEEDFPEKYLDMNKKTKFRPHPRNLAPDLICIEITRKLKNTQQVIAYATSAGTFVENINCPNLITAMYMQLYQSLVTGKKFRKCANETCPEWFEITSNDDKSKYCKNYNSDGQSICASQQESRKNRKQIKTAKELFESGKSIQEISDIINSNRQKKVNIKSIEKWVTKTIKIGK